MPQRTGSVDPHFAIFSPTCLGTARRANRLINCDGSLTRRRHVRQPALPRLSRQLSLPLSVTIRALVTTTRLMGRCKADPVGSALPPIHLFVDVRELCTQGIDNPFLVCNLRLEVDVVVRSVRMRSVNQLRHFVTLVRHTDVLIRHRRRSRNFK
jgi:hypothetical protein